MWSILVIEISDETIPYRSEVDGALFGCDTLCMKRTTLMLDDDLLEEALRLGEQRTYSKTVNLALEEFVRRIKARKILLLGHSGLWEGDLGEMRRDTRGEES